MKLLLIPAVILLLLTVYGCDKMEEKPASDNNKQRTMPNDDIHNPQKENSGDNTDKSPGLTKAADESFEKYSKDKSDENKKEAVGKSMEAAMYLMYDAPLPPKDKYGPALRYFRRVLELDPGNKEAKVNKEKIEEIYQSMGKPIPQS
jgi:hypothetical protein